MYQSVKNTTEKEACFVTQSCIDLVFYFFGHKYPRGVI